MEQKIKYRLLSKIYLSHVGEQKKEIKVWLFARFYLFFIGKQNYFM